MSDIKGIKELGSCKVCQGTVVSSTTTRLREGAIPVFGPGGRDQYYNHTEYYCRDCGVSYKFWKGQG